MTAGDGLAIFLNQGLDYEEDIDVPLKNSSDYSIQNRPNVNSGIFKLENGPPFRTDAN